MDKTVKEILLDDFWIMPATPEYIDDGVPYITSKNIKNGKIDFSKANHISQEAYDSISKNRPILQGDILISMIGTLGETAEVKSEDGQFYGQNMFLIRLDESQIDKRYFLNYFKSSTVRRSLEGKQNQSTQKYLKANHIEDLTIPVIDILEQKKAATILDKLSTIIERRQEELQKLDNLIKSRFVEMFGDPVLNPYGWEQTTLKDVAVGNLSYGSCASAVEFDGTCRYVRITDITESGGLNDDVKSPDKYDEKYLLHDGDVLFARSGATVGKTLRYSSEKHGKGIYAGYLIRLVPNIEKVLPDYVFYYTKTEYYASFVKKAQRAVAQPNINAQEYGDLIICVPPIELQEKFMAFVTQVDKLKFEVQRSLDETQMLMDSLMQKYFG